MSHQTWLHRIVRPAVRPLVATPVTPNHVTTLRLAAGLAAAAALAMPDPTARGWGALLFLLSMLLDRADGELARMSGKSTPWGHRYDLAVDTLCNALAFVGLGYGLRGGAFGAWAPLMGLLAGIAIAVILLIVLRVEARRGPRAGELTSRGGFDADDALLVLPVAVWGGLAEPLLLAAALGAPVFALFMALKFRGVLTAG